MANKFQLYEVVKVISNHPNLPEINGQEGHVIGIYDNGDRPSSYSVLFYELDEDPCREIEESALLTTGRIGKREDHYPGDTIKVRPDGSVVQDDE